MSLGAVLAMYVLCLCLAKGGGYGTIPHGAPPPQPGQRVPFWDKLAIRWGGPCCPVVHCITCVTLAVLARRFEWLVGT